MVNGSIPELLKYDLNEGSINYESKRYGEYCKGASLKNVANTLNS